MTLDAAIRQGDAVAVLALLRAGADPCARDVEGLTPLMVAAGLGHLHIAQLLLTAGAEVGALEPRMGTSALHKAAQSGNADVVRLLLEHGAFIDLQSPLVGQTALMDAVLHKHEGVVRLLLAQGARTSPRNHAGASALDLARDDHLTAIAEAIAERNHADATRLEALELIGAVKRNELAEVRRLAAQGRELDARTPRAGWPDEDCTALGLAAREGRAAIVAALLEAGADARTVNGPMGATALHEAAYFGHADVVRALVAASSDGRAPGIDVQGAYNGMTALHDAVWHGHLEAARALVDAGAPLHATSHAGLTPRALARRYGYDEIAGMLDAAERAAP